MKNFKKIAGLALAIVMILSMCVNVFAQTVDSEKGGSAKITITNASKGETYSVYKLFDATVTGNEGGSIAYSGTIPESLNTYFSQDTRQNVLIKDNIDEKALFDALDAWAKTATAEKTAVADGSVLEFTNLAYGYYVITSTQGAKAITVTSTNPNATINDKNVTELSVTKTVNDENVNIGQTVTYTVEVVTTNYVGAGTDAKKVTKYIIEDTLPDFLKDVKVTSISVDGTALQVKNFTDKKIEVEWVDSNVDSLYKNGAKLVITYTATVTDEAVVDGEGNANTVKVTPFTTVQESPKTSSTTIKTYAAVLKKVDETQNALAGAKFAANGLTVTGSAGNYTVVSYDKNSTTLGTEMETDKNGKLVIMGLASDEKLTVTETEAPNGYNKLVNTIDLQPTVINETVTVTSSEGTVTYNSKFDATENETTVIKVVNNKGALLPETGGTGTTIILVAGAILLVFAAVLITTKKRMLYTK